MKEFRKKFFNSDEEYNRYLGTVARHLNKGGVPTASIAKGFGVSTKKVVKLMKRGVCHVCCKKECCCG